MVNWKPHIGRKTSFKREHNNNYNKFAVAGKTLLIEWIGAVTVVIEGQKFQATVYDTKTKPSSLIQGGLEIPIKVKIIWSQEKSFGNLKQKLKKLSNQWQANIMMTQSLYNDEKHKDKKDDADDDVAHDDDDDDYDYDEKELLKVEEQYRDGEEDIEITDLKK